MIQPRFSASRFWGVALEHNCTWTSTIPFCMKALLEHEIPKRHQFRLWGTAVCDPPPFAAFGIKIIEQYSAWQPEKMLEQFRQAVAAKPDCIEIMGHPGNNAFEPLVKQARDYSFDFLAWKKAFVFKQHVPGSQVVVEKFDKYYEHALQPREYTPYEWRIVSSLVRLGQRVAGLDQDVDHPLEPEPATGGRQVAWPRGNPALRWTLLVTATSIFILIGRKKKPLIGYAR